MTLLNKRFEFNFNEWGIEKNSFITLAFTDQEHNLISLNKDSPFKILINKKHEKLKLLTNQDLLAFAG